MPGVRAVQGAAATTDAVETRVQQFEDILLVTVVIAGATALLIALNASTINADERVREHATMFAHGVRPTRVLRGSIAEALMIGALGTAAGIAAGRGVLSWIVSETCPRRCPTSGR